MQSVLKNLKADEVLFVITRVPYPAAHHQHWNSEKLLDYAVHNKSIGLTHVDRELPSKYGRQATDKPTLDKGNGEQQHGLAAAQLNVFKYSESCVLKEACLVGCPFFDAAFSKLDAAYTADAVGWPHIVNLYRWQKTLKCIAFQQLPFEQVEFGKTQLQSQQAPSLRKCCMKGMVYELIILSHPANCISSRAIWLLLEILHKFGPKVSVQDTAITRQCQTDIINPMVAESVFELYSISEVVQLHWILPLCISRILDCISIATLPTLCWLSYKYKNPILKQSVYGEMRELLSDKKIPSEWVLTKDKIEWKPYTFVLEAISSTISVPVWDASNGTVCFKHVKDAGYFLYYGKKIYFSVFVDAMRANQAAAYQLLRPFEGQLLCRLYRFRNSDGSFPHRYTLCTEHSDQILIYAIKTGVNVATKMYAYTKPMAYNEATNWKLCAENYVGSIESRQWGLSHSIYDGGEHVLFSQQSLSHQWPHFIRNRLASIKFDTNILGERPRHITVTIEKNDTIFEMENLPPEWDEDTQCYRLPFYGRAQLPSAKNFQLVHKQKEGLHSHTNSEIFLLFGKISKNVFSLVFRHPLSQVEAMGVAVAALTKKIVVR